MEKKVSSNIADLRRSSVAAVKKDESSPPTLDSHLEEKKLQIQKKIKFPGCSFILILSDEFVEGTEAYDCILCFQNAQRTHLEGIIQHCKSKEHLLKVMELVNPKYADFCSKNETVNENEMAAILMSKASNLDKDGVSFAPISTFLCSRKQIFKRILTLRKKPLKPKKDWTKIIFVKNSPSVQSSCSPSTSVSSSAMKESNICVKDSFLKETKIKQLTSVKRKNSDENLIRNPPQKICTPAKKIKLSVDCEAKEETVTGDDKGTSEAYILKKKVKQVNIMGSETLSTKLISETNKTKKIVQNTYGSKGQKKEKVLVSNTPDSKSECEKTISQSTSIPVESQKTNKNDAKIAQKTADKKQNLESKTKKLMIIKSEGVAESTTMKSAIETGEKKSKSPVKKIAQNRPIQNVNKQQKQILRKMKPVSKSFSLDKSKSGAQNDSKATDENSVSECKSGESKNSKEGKLKYEKIIWSGENSKNEDSNDTVVNTLDIKKTTKASSPGTEPLGLSKSIVSTIESKILTPITCLQDNPGKVAEKSDSSQPNSDTMLKKELKEKQVQIQNKLKLYLGHSFILVLSDKVIEDKKAYDCVLCYKNTKRTNLEGIIHHCKMKAHLLKVMGLVNPKCVEFCSRNKTRNEIEAVLKRRAGDLDQDGISFSPLCTFLSVRKKIFNKIKSIHDGLVNVSVKANENRTIAIPNKNSKPVQSPKGTHPCLSSSNVVSLSKNKGRDTCVTVVQDSLKIKISCNKEISTKQIRTPTEKIKLMTDCGANKKSVTKDCKTLKLKTKIGEMKNTKVKTQMKGLSESQISPKHLSVILTKVRGSGIKTANKIAISKLINKLSKAEKSVQGSKVQRQIINKPQPLSKSLLLKKSKPDTSISKSEGKIDFTTKSRSVPNKPEKVNTNDTKIFQKSEDGKHVGGSSIVKSTSEKNKVGNSKLQIGKNTQNIGGVNKETKKALSKVQPQSKNLNLAKSESSTSNIKTAVKISSLNSEAIKLKKGEKINLRKKHSTDDTFDLKNLNKLEKEVYESYEKEINELVELQKNRRPNKIIIVTDVRDVFAEEEVQSCNYQYKIFKGMNLAFDNLNKYLIQNQDFGKGVLYVILCGINSIYREKINPKCLKTRCITPCKFLDTTNYDIDLIKMALHVHKLILKFTKNDTAIFSALLPASPKYFNNLSYQQRKCFNIHEAPPPSQCSSIFDKYKLCLYNTFTKLHSKLLGFTPLDLEKGFEQYSNNPTLYFSFTANGYHFTDTFASDRKSSLLKQCDLLMKRLSQSLNLGEDETGNKPDEGVKKVSESSKLLETNSSMSEPNYEPKWESSTKAANSEVKSSRISKYDKIVVLGSSHHKYYLEQLESSKVCIISEDIYAEDLLDYIKQKKTSMPPNTLWVLVTDVGFLFFKSVYKSCQDLKCIHPLQAIEPKDEVTSISATLKTLNTLKELLKNIENNLKGILSFKSDFMFFPPIPPAMIIDSSVSHQNLHVLMLKQPKTFIVTQELAFHFSNIFEKLSLSIANLTRAALSKIGISADPIEKYLDCHLNQIDFIDSIITSPPNKLPYFSEWLNIFKNILSACDGNSSCLEIPNEQECLKSSRIVEFYSDDNDEERDFSKSKVSRVIGKTMEVSEKASNVSIPKQLSKENFKKSEEEDSKSTSNVKINHSFCKPKPKYKLDIFDIAAYPGPPVLTDSLESETFNDCSELDFNCSELDFKAELELEAEIFPCEDISDKSICDEEEMESEIFPYEDASDESLCNEKVNDLSGKFSDLNSSEHAKIKDSKSAQEEIDTLKVDDEQQIADQEHYSESQKTENDVEKTICEMDLTKENNILSVEVKDSSRNFKTNENVESLATKEIIDKDESLEDALQQAENEEAPNIKNNIEIKDSPDTDNQDCPNIDNQIQNEKSIPARDPSLQQSQENIEIFNVSKEKISDINDSENVIDQSGCSTYDPFNPTSPNPESDVTDTETDCNEKIVDHYKTSAKSMEDPSSESEIQADLKNKEACDDIIILESNKSNKIVPYVLLSDSETDEEQGKINTDFGRKTNALKEKKPNVTLSNYDHIYVIGHINPLSKKNRNFLNYTFIEKALSDLDEESADNLLSKKFPIVANSVCICTCNILDICETVIKSKLLTSVHRRRFFILYDLKDSSSEQSSSEATAEGRMFISKMVTSFIKIVNKLRERLPVIVMPLEPFALIAKLKCPFYENKADALTIFVRGSPDKWNDYRDVFVHDWNRILDTNDEKINKMSCWNSFVNVPSIIYPVGRDDLDDKTIVKQRSLWGQNVNETLRRLHKKKLQQSFNNASTKPIRSISYQSSADGQETNNKESDYEEYIIEVANITDSIPHKFFQEMCYVAAEKEVLCKFIKGSVYITFDSCSIGSFFLDYFDNLAIGDTVLKTSLCKKECKLPNFQIENSTSISLQNRLLPYLEKWKYKILLVVKKNLRHTLSCESFKTIKCYKSDCDESRCIFYHSEIDRRRNPFSIPYKSMACRISSGSVCLYGDNCQFAHNRYESIFHPFNLYSKICMDYKARNKCFVKNQLCALAHQDSPETFFTKYWKDSLVLGTSLCVEFLAGAIRKVHFYGTFFKDCRIFVIGASDEFLDNTWVAVKDICNKHYSYIYNFAGEKVFGREPLLFGKPSKFVSIIDRLALCPFTLIIVSQIDVILGIESERRALVEFFSRSKMFAHPDVQSLFVADQYDSRLPVKIKMNLGKEVKVIQNPGHNVTFPYDVPYTPIRTPPTWLAKALNQLQEEEVKKEKSELCLWFRKGNVDSLDPSENDDFEDLSSEEERNSGRRGIKRKPIRSYRSRSSSYHKSRSKSPVHKRHRSRSRSRSRRSSSKRRSSSRYSLKRPVKRCRSRQSYSPPTSSNNSFRRSSSSSISPDRTPFMEEKDKDDAENIKILSLSRCEEQEKKSEFSMERIVHQSILLELATQMFNNTSLLEELGDDLFEEFEAERKEICFKLEEDFEDYKTMPYLYERYEDCYEGFMQVYKIKYQNQSKEHQEMMWKEYWKSNFDFIEKMELQKRMMSLRKKFREKLESLPPPPPPPPVISVQDTRLGLNKSEINISLSSQGYSSVIKSDSTSQPTNDIGSCSNETYSSSSNLVTPNLYSLSTEENLDRQIASINTPLLTDDKIVPGLDQHHSVTENQNILPPENSEEALIVHNNSCQTNTDSSVDSSKKQIPPLDGVHSTLLPISKESSPSNIDDSKSETPLPDNVHSPMPEISMETSSLHIKDLSNKDVTANKSAFQSAIDSFDDGINRETPPSKRDHCLVPTIPLESSLANIETLSKEDVTVIESSFPTAIDPSNDDSKRETSPADQGVHSPLNLTSVKYSPTHIKALTKDPSSDLENECLDEALVSQSVSNNLVSSENMTIIDKQAESFPLVTPTMILTHTEENEEKITINESNTSEVSESESSLQNFSMDKAIADLELMVPDIGDLGSSLNTIISFSKEEGIDSEKSLRNFANPDNVTLMERALTKIKCLESWKDLYSSLERSVNSLIKYTRKEVEKKEKNDLALDCERIAKDTIGKDPSLILEMIRTTAAKEGVKLTKHQESEIYIKVCFIHFNLVSSKE